MNELTYTMQGDYNLPDLTMPKQPESPFRSKGKSAGH